MHRGQVEMKTSSDHWRNEQIRDVSDICSTEEMDAEDPLFILYTSGSTGKPKGLVHTTYSYMLYTEFVLKKTFNIKKGMFIFVQRISVGLRVFFFSILSVAQRLYFYPL
ncbi:MAG: AMP-binding protein [Flavobacteriales bacterium Tduv]